MGCVVMSGIRYIGYLVYSFYAKKNPKGDHFVTLKNSTRNVISAIRYIRFALNPVWVVSLYPVYVIPFIRYIRFALNPVWVVILLKGTPLHLLQLRRILEETLYPVFVISGIRYIRFALNPVWAVSGIKLYRVFVISGLR